MFLLLPYPEIFTNPNPTRGTGLDDVLNTRVKAIMNANGDRAKKIWLTEMGWSTSAVTESRQAQYMTSSYEMLDDLRDPAYPDDPPYVDRYFWFCYTDFSAADMWGLVTQDQSRQKPSYAAYLALTPAGPKPPEDTLEPGENPPVWNTTSDASLAAQVSATDLIAGRVGEIVSGGFHSANVGTASALTNGQIDSNPLTLVLADYDDPALRVRYTFDPPVDISEVRMFAGHFSDGGNRAFQSNDIYVNGVRVATELTTGNYGQVSGGTSAVSLVRWLPAAGEMWAATKVTSLEVEFWCTSSINGGFLDRWDPLTNPELDNDGAGPAYVAPIIKEIDVLGEISPAITTGSTFMLY